MTNFIDAANTILWGVPALVLILSVGLYLTVRLGFIQLRLLPEALSSFFRKLWGKGEDSGFRALCTALAATVGTGNLVGVAGAICLGGPGAVFWMWLCGLLGMVTKFAEAVLAVRYRVKTESGFQGGPMYVIEQGLGQRWKPLAVCYSAFGLIAAFGVGNAAQINAVVTGIHEVLNCFHRESSKTLDLLVGMFFALLLGVLLLGGFRRVGAAAELLVPIGAAGYIVLCLGVLLLRRQAVSQALHAIVSGAFDPRAVTGGLLGSGFQALRTGCARGVFTNEAGMGTAAMAHGSAEVDHPVQQGLMGLVEVFLDTMVICTLTALVILCSGVFIPYGVDAGGTLTTRAFASVYGHGAALFLAGAMIAFAVATVLGWGYYGGCCARYLFGDRAWKAFSLVHAAMVAVGAVMDTALVWQVSEVLNGLMVIPNLITLAALSPEVVRLTKEYRRIKNTGDSLPVEVSYADFH